MNTLLETVCYRSKTLADGSSPVMLRLTKNGKRKYVSLHISVKATYWDFNKNQPKRNCPDKDAILSIIEKRTAEYRTQINEFKVENKDYTLDSLVKRVENPMSKHQTVGTFLDQHIEYLKSINRRGYAKTFEELKRSLLDYCKSLEIFFSDIDHEWLKKYEAHLKGKNYAMNSIGIRFRTLRVLYNYAITCKVVKKDYYPFDDFKVSKMWEQTQKRAITKEDIKKIAALDLKTVTPYYSPYLDFGRDLFLFSYLSAGINFTDMAKLTYGNIFNGRVSYHRQKTKKLITFQLQPMAMEIVEKYRKKDARPNDYIFPILDRKVHKTETQIRDRIHKSLGATNKALHKIGEKLELPIDLTTYVARHSFATVLKRSGVSTSIISESLGHSSEKVTQIYLDSFENEQIDNAMKNLL